MGAFALEDVTVPPNSPSKYANKKCKKTQNTTAEGFHENHRLTQEREKVFL